MSGDPKTKSAAGLWKHLCSLNPLISQEDRGEALRTITALRAELGAVARTLEDGYRREET